MRNSHTQEKRLKNQVSIFKTHYQIFEHHRNFEDLPNWMESGIT